MPPVPAGYARFNYIITLNTDPDPMMVTLAADIAVVTFSDVEGICNDAMEASRPVFEDITTAYALERVDGYFGGSGLVGVSTDPAIVGTDAGNSLTQNTAYLIHKNTGQGGRRNRGRMFIPGVHQDNANSDGTLAPGVVPAWNIRLDDWLTNLQAYAWCIEVVLLHGDGGEPTIIQSLTMDQRVATQRRRLR
jgi:hypothetical protein